MPIQLADMRVGMTNKVQAMTVDTMIRQSQIMELLPFDDCVSPGGGSTLAYGYIQTKLPAVAKFRALNQEYTPSEATVEPKTVTLRVFGNKFEIDRVLNQAAGQYDNIAFQVEQSTLAVVGAFHDAMINGDGAGGDFGEATQFDGLDKMLVGQQSEKGTDKVVDLSTISQLKANADEFYEALMNLIVAADAQALLCNHQVISKIQTIARVLGYKTESEQAFGRRVLTIDPGVRLIDLGNVYGVTSGSRVGTPVIGIKNRTVNSTPATGLTDIYAVRFAVLDGFHGITLTGDNGIKTYLPDFKTPGVVKAGEVEMVGGVALKSTQAAGVLRNIKIA